MGFFDKIKDKGNELTEVASKKIKETTESFKDWSSESIKNAGEWSKEALNNLSDFSSDSWQQLGEYSQAMKTWSKEMPDKLKNYTADFNLEDFWNKIAETGKKIGQDMIFMALACYYAVVEFFKKNEREEEKFVVEKPAVTSIKIKAKSQNRVALGIIHAYVKLNPETTIDNLKSVFPNSLAPDSGVKELFVSPDIAQEHNDKMTLYFDKDYELVYLGDGTPLALASVWTKASFERISKVATGHNIEIEKLSVSPNKRGFILE